MKTLHPLALFRLSVLGPLVSREPLAHGELQTLLRDLAARDYAIPGSDRHRVGEKTLEAWYYAWRREGIDGLVPKTRCDRRVSKLPVAVQEALLAAKRAQPRRSIRQLQQVLEQTGVVARGTVSRSAIHRFLQHQGLSRSRGASHGPEEHRRFVAEFANSIWYGDVLHGPTLTLQGQRRKVYLVSLMDDASRLIAHSAFCLGETALDIEGVLKQAVLKRGLPTKLVVDNGAAYRANTLQGICARLAIHLIYCRPYAPEGKGKLERWHRTFRDQFLSELDTTRIRDLEDLNARLWAWLEQVYHRRPHGGLAGLTPLARYQQDLPKLRLLGPKAAQLDALFYHRVARKVRKDGTVAYQGRDFEVPYELSGQTVQLVVDPQAAVVMGVEDREGQPLGAATPLDALANAHRRRRRPVAADTVTGGGAPQRRPTRLKSPISSTTRTGCRSGRSAKMYRQHFGLSAAPLANDRAELWDDGVLARLEERFQWLLQSPGIGLLTGEPGVGKTAVLRQFTQRLNPHRYQVIYLAETDFGRQDLYQSLALALGLEPVYRRAQLWRDIKAAIQERSGSHHRLPLWILDEAQNLPPAFFRDLPSFLNFGFDAQPLLVVWLVGHPALGHLLERAPYAALAGRIQVRIHLKPVLERERFAALVQHALKEAGCQHTLLADSGMELLRQASQGLPRQAGRLLRAAMRLAVPKGLNHLPDELLQQAIEELR